MRRTNLACLVMAAVAALAVPAAPRSAAAGEEPAPAVLNLPSDPCGFYRGQAYGRGLEHFLTEMLWACEAIASRRSAGMPLSERLIAADLALERYRAAVVAAGAVNFAAGRAAGTGAVRFASADAMKSTLAAQTGTLDALEAIRFGF